MTNKFFKFINMNHLTVTEEPQEFDFDLDEALDFKNIRTLEIKQR